LFFLTLLLTLTCLEVLSMAAVVGLLFFIL